MIYELGKLLAENVGNRCALTCLVGNLGTVLSAENRGGKVREIIAARRNSRNVCGFISPL